MLLYHDKAINGDVQHSRVCVSAVESILRAWDTIGVDRMQCCRKGFREPASSLISFIPIIPTIAASTQAYSPVACEFNI